MQEYFSEAIVLAREPVGEADSRVSLFTEKFGKFVGRATSARKITSKLSSHLEPGFLIDARFVEKNGLKIVDALKMRRIKAEAKDLSLLAGILHDGEPDHSLWEFISSEVFKWNSVLRILGWDPVPASCLKCGKKPTVFILSNQEFFCSTCVSGLSGNALIYMETDS